MKIIRASVATGLVAFGCAVASLAGCSAAPQDETGATEEELRIVNGPFRFRSPGTFDLDALQGAYPARMPKPCDSFTSLRLENAPLAKASLVGAANATPGSPAMCGTTALAPREFALNFARVEDSGVKIYRGVQTNSWGGTATIEIIDRREASTMILTYPPPALVEVVVTGSSGDPERLYQRLAALPAEASCSSLQTEAACSAQIGCMAQYAANGTSSSFFKDCAPKACSDFNEATCRVVSRCEPRWLQPVGGGGHAPVFVCAESAQ